ncbi:MAG: hypothetical protein LBU81_05470 [Methanosarcinales archaeon]|jgi:hypothetical protein|nr:hypothetical protein [Methanosarcinales archaeon]
MECEYLVYDPKSKKIEVYTYPATIPLKDFYNRKLRNMKSCIISYNTKETSLVIDNYKAIDYYMWSEALDYFKNKRSNEVKKTFNQNKKTILYTSILLIFLMSAVLLAVHVSNNYSSFFSVNEGGSLIEVNKSLIVVERQTINDEIIVGRWIDDTTGCVIIFDSSYGYYSPLSPYLYYGGKWRIENNHTLVMYGNTETTEYMRDVIEMDSWSDENGTIARGSIQNGELVLTSYVIVNEINGFPEGKFRPA